MKITGIFEIEGRGTVIVTDQDYSKSLRAEFKNRSSKKFVKLSGNAEELKCEVRDIEAVFTASGNDMLAFQLKGANVATDNSQFTDIDWSI